MRADDRRQRMKIEEGKKVDCAKLPIHCRRATDFCSNGQVFEHELLRRRARCRPTIDIHSERRMWHSSPHGCSQIFATQLLLHCDTILRILPNKRATSDEKSCVSLAGLT